MVLDWHRGAISGARESDRKDNHRIVLDWHRGAISGARESDRKDNHRIVRRWRLAMESP
ncbi:MAG: hypothetical protein ACREFV_11420 [Acetobacteraceae bacterium]